MAMQIKLIVVVVVKLVKSVIIDSALSAKLIGFLFAHVRIENSM